jgi:hypothetical protein
MDSSAHTAPIDSETVKEDSVTGLPEIVTKNVSRADAWIHQRTLPLFTQKESRKTESLPTQKSSLKMFPQLTHGFISAHYPLTQKESRETESLPHTEIALETAFTGHKWIRQPTQPLLTQKQSRKTRSLDSQKSS